jgi:hypothetical protein
MSLADGRVRLALAEAKARGLAANVSDKAEAKTAREREWCEAGLPLATLHRILDTYQPDDSEAAYLALSAGLRGLPPGAVALTFALPPAKPAMTIEEETRAVLIKLGIDPDYATVKDSDDLARRRKAKAAK